MSTQPQQEQKPQTQALTIADNRQSILRQLQNEKFKQQLAASLMARLPEDYVVRAAISVINSDTKIQECTPLSIAASILLLAQAGLATEPWKGHGWLIPRNKKIKEPGKPDRWIKVCTALIGYRGFVALAARSPEVAKTGSLPVFEGDIFELDLGSGQPPIHQPWIRPTEERPARGGFIGDWAFAKLRNGEYMIEWMTKEDIDKIRKRSDAADSGPWVTDYVEMARKTVYRRLFKWLPDPELQRIAAMDEASELGKMDSMLDAETGEIITVPREELPEEKPTAMSHTDLRLPHNNGNTGAAVTTDEGKNQPIEDDKSAAPSNAELTPAEADIAAASSPFKQEEAAGQRELTLDRSDTQERAEPGTKHISEGRVKRLFAILHAAQKVEGSGAPSDEQLRQHVHSLGYANETLIPNDKDIYERCCDFAGGKVVKTSNGKK